MSKQGPRSKLHSGFLLKDDEHGSDEAFRQEFLMHFPRADQRSLKLLGKLLYFKEDLLDEHFPLFKGSHNLAYLHAASLDLLAVAKSLASAAAFLEDELTHREQEAARLADRYAVKVARLAADVLKATEEVAALKKGGGRKVNEHSSSALGRGEE
jgi:hypothetical protein